MISTLFMRFSLKTTHIDSHSELGDFPPISSYFNFRSSRQLPGHPPIVPGESHLGKTIRGVVPRGERIIAVHIDGVITISIPIILLRECPVIPYQKTPSAVLSEELSGDYVPFRNKSVLTWKKDGDWYD
jgi:hypothetical protein